MDNAQPVKSPTVIYFKADGTRGLVRATQEHSYWTFRFEGASRDSDFSVASDDVRSVSPEDGGIGVGYGVFVEYRSNSDGYLGFAKHGRPFRIAECHVRRVLNGKEVAWQNPNAA